MHCLLSEMFFEVSKQAHLRNEHRMCDIEHGVTLKSERPEEIPVFFATIQNHAKLQGKTRIMLA